MLSNIRRVLHNYTGQLAIKPSISLFANERYVRTRRKQYILQTSGLIKEYNLRPLIPLPTLLTRTTSFYGIEP